ncbi:MAG TPA: hypothetical protein VHZ98_16445 [Galbitalea sp.]|nr:hypothetical protein [Galbitalea sp.]
MTDDPSLPSHHPSERDLEEWTRHVAGVLTRDEFSVPVERARDFQLLYGFCIQAARFASNYLVLRDQGFEREARLRSCDAVSSTRSKPIGVTSSKAESNDSQ